MKHLDLLGNDPALIDHILSCSYSCLTSCYLKLLIAEICKGDNADKALIADFQNRRGEVIRMKDAYLHFSLEQKREILKLWSKEYEWAKSLAYSKEVKL